MNGINSAYVSGRADLLELLTRSPKRVLDAGCSNGALGQNLKRRFPGAYVVGVERDPHLAAEAAARLDRVLVADLNGTGWTRDLGRETFDLIICGDVLEHLVDPAAALLALVSLLSSGSLLIVSLPNVRHWTALFQLLVLGDWPSRDSGLFDRTHLHFFTRRSATRLLKGCGLSLERVTGKYHDLDHLGYLGNRVGRALLAVPILKEYVAYQWLFVCSK